MRINMNKHASGLPNYKCSQRRTGIARGMRYDRSWGCWCDGNRTVPRRFAEVEKAVCPP
jgi:hypothetical protein